jgi:polyhydroxyalkanoate synthesis regulator phasin
METRYYQGEMTPEECARLDREVTEACKKGEKNGPELVERILNQILQDQKKPPQE